MSRENVEIIERAFAALGREEWVSLGQFYAPDAEIYDFDIPDAGVYRGPEGVVQWLERWGDAWASWEARDIEVSGAAGEHVVASFTIVARGRDSGVELTRRDAIVYTLRNGKIARSEYYNEHQKAPALEAVGLSE
jgi:ketosteroid isomerase-like protein